MPSKSRFTRPVLLAGAIAGAALLAGCNKTGATSGGDTPAAVDTAAIEQALRANEIQWNADYKARDLAKVESHYATDATVMDPQSPAMNGAAAIHAGFSELLKDPNLALQFSADKVGVSPSGDLAYTQGHFKLVVTNPKTNQPVSDSGSYVTIYKKQADGSWKAVEDIASSSEAAP